MTRVYLLRHGETPWNAEGNRYCGRTDVPLSAQGRRQARDAAAALADRPLAAAISSPLARALETAGMVAGGRLEVEADPRFLEVDFGGWEGLAAEEIPAVDPDGWAAWLADPGSVRAGGTGETGGEVVDRAAAALDDLRRRLPGQELVLVGHNTLNRLLLVAALGAPLASYRRLSQANGCINVVDLDGSGSRIVGVNRVSHLRLDGQT